MITFDDFLKVDMRVGRVLAVDDFPEARKPAWKLTIDFGPELGTKRSSAQITNYAREELEGAQLHKLRQLPYSELARRAEGGWTDEDVAGLSGVAYRRRTRVLRSDDLLHIRILIDDGTRAGSLRPLAEEIVHVMPDGHFLRERTVASSNSERRRYKFPGRWYPFAVGILAVALILLA